jgi:hypothetical protein
MVQREHAGGKKEAVPGSGDGETPGEKFPQLENGIGVLHCQRVTQREKVFKRTLVRSGPIPKI